jgi:hypothetical protein
MLCGLRYSLGEKLGDLGQSFKHLSGNAGIFFPYPNFLRMKLRYIGLNLGMPLKISPQRS